MNGLAIIALFLAGIAIGMSIAIIAINNAGGKK